MKLQIHIMKLVLLVLLLASCSSVQQTQKLADKSDVKSSAKAKTFTCSDGLLVASHEECVIYDPIIPYCDDSDGNFVYEINSGDLTEFRFYDNLEKTIPFILDGIGARYPDPLWSCKLVKLEITGHADSSLKDKTAIISQLAAKQIENAFLEHGVPKEIISITSKGGIAPFMKPQSPPVADILNNRVNVKTKFEIEY